MFFFVHANVLFMHCTWQVELVSMNCNANSCLRHKEPPRMQPLSALVYADFEHCEFESTPDKDIATTEPTVTMSPAQAAIEVCSSISHVTTAILRACIQGNFVWDH